MTNKVVAKPVEKLVSTETDEGREIYDSGDVPVEVQKLLRLVALNYGAGASEDLFKRPTWFLEDRSMLEMVEAGERTTVEALAFVIVSYYVTF